MDASLTVRDWHGLRRSYVRVADRRRGAALGVLVTGSDALDREGVLTAWGLATAHERTAFASVGQLACGHGWRPPPTPGDLETALLDELGRIATTYRAPALALGGGLDAAVVLAGWRRLGFSPPAVLTLETDVDGYDEVGEAEAIARAVGMSLEVVHASAESIAELIDPAVAACETPLYNLHPISRLALARAAHRRGHDALITGDGADAVFAGLPDADYVPLLAALTRAAGLALGSPFLADRVVAAALAGGPDPKKRALRRLAASLELPSWLLDRAKAPRMFPAIDLSPRWHPGRLAGLARELEIELRDQTDRQRVGWVTLDSLARHVRGGG